MKKLINKLRRKSENTSSTRITTDTIIEHRKKILAGGRKYKYPIQYAKHKLVINAIIIAVIVLLISVFLIWWQLYPKQNTSQFMYRVTKVIPVPVAEVDNHQVLYSDYLMKYISSVYYLEKKEQINFKTEDGERRIAYIKQQSIDDAIADAYAEKLAKDLDLSVKTSELEGFIKEQRSTSSGEISEQTYNSVILDHFGWSPAEYRYAMSKKILRQKVAYRIDEDAFKLANKLHEELKANSKLSFKNVAKNLDNKATYGTSGWVSKDNQDGGLSSAASKLKINAISGLIKSTLGDGYYIVKPLKINDEQVNYEYIKIPLTKFDTQIKELEKAGKINKYISVPKE
ncbi:MAG: SurA N-terminal domain-containing protein [Candidatus Saccharimonadales bacterium]